MTTGHIQVPCLDFRCDEDIAELIALMNACKVETLLSCQDNNGGRGTVRRVWVEVDAADLNGFLLLLDQPGEADADRESLSNRIAGEYEPDDWLAFREDRAWHYAADVSRCAGEILPLAVHVRFPWTDLGEVVARLRAALASLDART